MLLPPIPFCLFNTHPISFIPHHLLRPSLLLSYLVPSYPFPDPLLTFLLPLPISLSLLSSPPTLSVPPSSHPVPLPVQFKSPDETNLSDDKKKLYSLIYRRTLASVMTPSQVRTIPLVILFFYPSPFSLSILFYTSCLLFSIFCPSS